MRHWIETGQREAGAPLGPEALADLNRLDATLSAPLYRHAFLLAPGDLLLLDNHRIAHDRTAYVDAPGQRRRMLRLWLNADGMAAEHG
jgi:alpha-ketoglutarate-dependent taurine dioxygenase